MTRIILLLDPQHRFTYQLDQPLPITDLLIAINTHSKAGPGKTAQWAMAHPPAQILTVRFSPTPVALTRRQYQVLFALCAQCTARQIAQQMGLHPHSVARITSEIKARFGVSTREEAIRRAVQLGWAGFAVIPPGPTTTKVASGRHPKGQAPADA